MGRICSGEKTETSITTDGKIPTDAHKFYREKVLQMKRD